MMMVVVVVKMVVIVMMVVVISVWPIAPQSEITDYSMSQSARFWFHNDVNRLCKGDVIQFDFLTTIFNTTCHCNKISLKLGVSRLRKLPITEADY